MPKRPFAVLACLALAVAVAPAAAAPPTKPCPDGSRVRMNQTCPATAPAPAPEPTPTPAPAPLPTSPSAVTVPAGYTVKQATGLKCDGVTDTTTALQSNLNGLASYQALELPAGTCVTSNILTIVGKTNVMVFGAGRDATIIKATNPLRSALIGTQGSGLIIAGLQVWSPNATTRTADCNGCGVYVFKASGVLVDNVKVVGPSAAGIYLASINGGTVQNSIVERSLADGFHITGTSQNITLQFNRADRVGDDAFASVGYYQTTGQLHNINILDNVSTDGAWAGGIGVEGTVGAVVARNRIYRSGIACIRLDSQTSGGYYTGPVENVQMLDNYLEGCGTRTNTGHGSIMMYANYFHVRGVTGSGNQIVRPTSGAGVRAYGTSATANIEAALTDTTFVDVMTPWSIGAYASVARP